MAYFKHFPQLEILNRTKNETSSDETHIVTNLFKRVKIREDILGAVSAFEDYRIDPGERPDSIAEKVYGDPELDWVVLLSNNITNLENQWLLILLHSRDTLMKNIPIKKNSMRLHIMKPKRSEMISTDLCSQEVSK